jgi:hypothetical protein
MGIPTACLADRCSAQPADGLCEALAPVLSRNNVLSPKAPARHAPSGLLRRIRVPLLGAAVAEALVVVGVRLIVVLVVIVLSPVRHSL